MPRPKSLIVKKYAFTLHITGALREHLRAAAYIENRSQVNLATHILETALAEKWPNADIAAINKAYKIKIADPVAPTPEQEAIKKEHAALAEKWWPADKFPRNDK